jgi:hypothetical protein
MSPVNRLWNHRLVLYRNEPATSEFNEPIAVWTKPEVPGGMNCTPNQNWAGGLQDHGPGIQQNAMRVWYLHKDVGPEETDILYIIEGPEAPLYLRVESATLLASLRRRGQPTSHIEVNVEVWPGDPSELEPGGGEDES